MMQNFFNENSHELHPALFAIYGGAFLHFNAPPPNEVAMLTWFLDYLKLALNLNPNIAANGERLFTFQEAERAKIISIVSILEQWLTDLKEVEQIKTANDTMQKIKNYSSRLHTRLSQPLEPCIIPCGLAQYTHQVELFNISSNIPWPSAAIVQGRTDMPANQRQWIQIDPQSDYHQKLRTFKKDYQSIALEMNEIAVENITQEFLEELITIRVLPALAPYLPEHLYEIMLARLDGKTTYKSEKDHTFKTLRNNIYCKSWYVIKSVFYYLMTQAYNPGQGRQHYKKIICDFQFYLLQSVHTKFKEKLPHLSESNASQWSYLLSEMMNKISSAAMKLEAESIHHGRLVNELDTIRATLNAFIESTLQKKTVERTWPTVFKSQAHFLGGAPNKFQDFIGKKFILTQIRQYASTNQTLRNRFVLAIDLTLNQNAYTKLEQVDASIHSFLKDATLGYNLNHCYQLAATIESTILSLLTQNFEHWYNGPLLEMEKVAGWLLNLAQIYYSTAGYIAGELMQNQATQDPIHSSKLILVTFSIYAMIDVLARKHDRMGAVLENYQTTTALNSQWSLNNISTQLMINDASWLSILSRLNTYFEKQASKSQRLFYHENYKNSFAVNATSDINDDNIRFILALLHQDAVNKSKFDTYSNQSTIDFLPSCWASLFCENISTPNQYLPHFFYYLRDIAYLAKYTLLGISNFENIKPMKSSNKLDIYTAFGRIRWSTSGTIYRHNTKIPSHVSVICMQSLYNNNGPILDLRYSIKNEKFSRLIYPLTKDEANNPVLATRLENHYIAAYRSKPDSLTKPHYLTLGFVRANLQIKLSRLYLALKNDILSLEVEEHCYLIKQTLFEVSEIRQDDTTRHFSCFIERRFKEKNFFSIFIQLFISLAGQLQQKPEQYRAFGHVLDILFFLHPFCSAENHILLDCIKELRAYALARSIRSPHPETCAIIWFAYVITTYRKEKATTSEDASNIFKCRKMIEEKARLGNPLPAQVYARVMETLFLIQDQLERILISDKSALNVWLPVEELNRQPPTNWSVLPNHLYQRGNYTLDPIQGVLYKNNMPVGLLPKAVYENKDYKEAFNTDLLLVELNQVSEQNKTLKQYQSTSNTTPSRHITLLSAADNGPLWIEESSDNRNYETFVPNHLVDKLLPKMLLNGYTHWWRSDDQILIKNTERETEYTLNLQTGVILAKKYGDQSLMPFFFFDSRQNPAHAIFWKVLTTFEDQNYILVLTRSNAGNDLVAPTEIHLPRFNLSFSIQGAEIISNNFKGYRLAHCQQLPTLLGFNNYLVIEENLPLANRSNTHSRHKVIIGHRRVSTEKADFVVLDFTVNLMDSPESPAYFTYEVDNTLGALKAESTAGKVYLAWLYYKTARRLPDSLFKMNAYEISAELLKSCWQNYAYEPYELDILLRFFTVDYNELLKLKQNKNFYGSIFSESAIFDQIFKLKNEQHREAIPIILRVLLLMNESLETHFLSTKASSVRLNKSYDKQRRQHLYHYGQKFFLYYLSVKSRVHEKCQLSTNEEIKFLHSCKAFNGSLNVYLQFYLDGLQNQNEEKSMKSQLSLKNYKKHLFSFLEKKALKNQILNTNLKNFLTAHYPNESHYYHLSPLPSKLENFVDWVNFSRAFNMKYFIDLFQFALSPNFSPEKFETMLHVLAIRAQYKFPFHMLFIIHRNREVFSSKPVPPFLTDQQNRHNYSKKFIFTTNFQDFTEQRFYYEFCNTDVFSPIKVRLWNAFNAEFHQNAENFIENIQSKIAEKFSSNNSTDAERALATSFTTSCAERLRICCIAILENKKLFDYFVDIAESCDKLNREKNLGKDFITIKGNAEQLANQPQIFASQTQSLYLNQSDLYPNENLSVDAILLDVEPNKFICNDWFEARMHEHEPVSFPLNPSELKKNAPARQILTENYGKSFTQALQDSYIQYSEAPLDKFKFKQGKSHIELLTHLNELVTLYHRAIAQLWPKVDEMLGKIPNTYRGYIYLLSKHAGITSFHTKIDALRLLEGREMTVNPFLSVNQAMIMSELRHYVQLEVYCMHLERIIDLIHEYNNLNEASEQQLLLDEIIQQLSYQQDIYSAESYPAWLLFELENKLTIRQSQSDLTKEMINAVQASENLKINTVYQLNMGEGKTSVILILLIHALADGNRLVRANVLEALMGVMKGLLSLKFDGLLKKRVYFLPFSRDVDISLANLEKIQAMLAECKNGKHVLLTTPEHRLCLKLKYQEKLLEYVKYKDAKNEINWDKYEKHYNWTYHYYLKDKMKEFLIKAGYIDTNNKIIKLPEDYFMEFSTAVKTKNGLNEYGPCGLWGAYLTLQTGSLDLKKMIGDQLRLLAEIEKSNFCDILDESDEMLRHGSELNYTLDDTKALDGDSFRWKLPSYLFEILFFDEDVSQLLIEAHKTGKVVYIKNWKNEQGIGGGIPFLRFVSKSFYEIRLKKLLAEKLLQRVAQELGIHNANFFTSSSRGQASYQSFVLGEALKLSKFGEENVLKTLNLQEQHTPGIRHLLLLCKGWLSHNLLYHVMSMRIQVEYGLDAKPGQMPENELCVPYKGLNNPAKKSEFSHPDVMIGLTFLSYYYQGLHKEQLLRALLILKKHPEKNSYLNAWFMSSKQWISEDVRERHEQFPNWIESFNTLDVDSEAHLNQATRYLGRNKNAIDYFLDAVVFPEKARYYERQITGNAHTLAGDCTTVGFSGTDDRKDTMPANIETKVLPSQAGTNGKMLHIISREVNKTYCTVEAKNTASFLLQVVDYVKNSESHVRALIDAGAMSTGMSNRQVANDLLTQLTMFKGIVFFDDDSGKILVLVRNQSKIDVIPIAACHFAKSELFVYFDDWHTRGSDLKLPSTARGIVTLCRDMNKDKLMQAVMRLRQLDSHQSVCFWGSPEISFSIAAVNGTDPAGPITSKEVLVWLAANTIQKISRSLYSVTMRKFEYVMKRRALLYQEKELEHPIESLIDRCAEVSIDQLTALYGQTPILQGTAIDILQRTQTHLRDKFREKLEGELQNISFNVTPAQRDTDFELDQQNMDEILNRTQDKIPMCINIAGTVETRTLETDQEKEKETERERIAETVQPDTRTPETETRWDYTAIFNPDFVARCNRNHAEQTEKLPKLFRLNDCFRRVDLDCIKDNIKKLKWQSNIWATESFIKTVNVDQHKKQDDYLRPVDTILVHKKSNETFFILVSGCEANEILPLFYGQYDQSDVFLIHLSDVNGDMTAPFGGGGAEIFAISETEARYIRIVLKLFNGECQFEAADDALLNRALGVITPATFINSQEPEIDENISRMIYDALDSQHYVQQFGFFSETLIHAIAINHLQIEENLSIYIAIIIETLKKLQEKSIVDHSTEENQKFLSMMPTFFKKIVVLRQTVDCFRGSLLEKKIGGL